MKRSALATALAAPALLAGAAVAQGTGLTLDLTPILDRLAAIEAKLDGLVAKLDPPSPPPTPPPVPGPDPTPTPTPTPTPGPTPTPAPTSEPLRVTLAFADGMSLAFSEADARDCGDFAGPGFVQRCLRADSGPWTVFFRPDRGSDRAEVVIELGRLWGAANQAAAGAGPYTATIARGDGVLATLPVPGHDWLARWRWQSAPRPVIRDRPAVLAALGLPAFDPELLKYCPPSRPVSYAGPMDSAGVYKAMATVGDRPDIGPLTEWQADYLATGSAAALASTLAQAEASGSVPWHFRDELTGAPLSFEAHPKAQWQRVASDPKSEVVKTIASGSGWKPEDSHTPALAAAPYAMTGDPYYLEELQHKCTYVIGSNYYHRSVQGLPQLVYPGETRAFAWGLRDLALAASLTPDVVPPWLLPRGYWARGLGQNLAYLNKNFVTDPKPASAIFRAATRQDMVASWMEGYLGFEMARATRLGSDGWRPALAWKIGSTVALASGRSGWPASWCTPYYYWVTQPDGRTPLTGWADAWARFKGDPSNSTIAAKTADPLPQPPAWAQPNSWGYTYQTLGPLAAAKSAGLTEADAPGLDAAYANAKSITLKGLADGRGPMRFSWAFADH